MTRVLLAVAVAAALTTAIPAANSARTTRTAHRNARVRVYFTDGEDIYAYDRIASPATVTTAIRELLKGPTPDERGQDVRTWIPKGTRLNRVVVRGGVARVDLGAKFLEGTDEASLRGRLAEVVYTATQYPSARKMRLLIDGTPASTLGQGISVDRDLTRINVDRPQPAELPPLGVGPDTQGAETAKTRSLQSRLFRLGYLPRTAITGHYGNQTTNAVLAFQGWEGLSRDGVAGPQTYARLARAKRPVPSSGTGKRVEVYLRSQVALLIGVKNQVLRVLHISSGKPSTATPPGSFKIYRKAVKDWSYPFSVWLPYASYFNGGIAFHEYPDVPPYPASHGCVRVPRDDAPLVYRFATIGTPVRVIG